MLTFSPATQIALRYAIEYRTDRCFEDSLGSNNVISLFGHLDFHAIFRTDWVASWPEEFKEIKKVGKTLGTWCSGQNAAKFCIARQVERSRRPIPTDLFDVMRLVNYKEQIDSRSS